MKTFGVLAIGWVVGGTLIVALSGDGARADAPAVASASIPAPADVVETPDAAGTAAIRPAGRRPHDDGEMKILIPVVGIRPDQLRDTFSQARSGGRVHRAIDILAPRGTPVIAAVDGTIRKLFTSAAGGLTIYQFDQAEERVYYYAHLDRYELTIAEGMFVAQGTVIGYVGTTGNAPPDAPHLHFAIEVLPPTKEWWKGTPVNPYPVLVSPDS